ncbi:MAG: hypothetical protein J5685_12170 [Clostridiales bacterium]|nr:hypothetical protein [Clostridiales bacterium]
MAFFDSKKNNIPVYQKSIEEKSVSIRKYYDEIGRLYYSQYKDLNVDNTKDINTRCEAVSRLSTEIEDLNLRILFERGLKRCTACGQENSLEYGFCFKCGAKFAEESARAPQKATPIKPASSEDAAADIVDAGADVAEAAEAVVEEVKEEVSEDTSAE